MIKILPKQEKCSGLSSLSVNNRVHVFLSSTSWNHNKCYEERLFLWKASKTIKAAFRKEINPIRRRDIFERIDYKIHCNRIGFVPNQQGKSKEEAAKAAKEEKSKEDTKDSKDSKDVKDTKTKEDKSKEEPHFEILSNPARVVRQQVCFHLYLLFFFLTLNRWF